MPNARRFLGSVKVGTSVFLLMFVVLAPFIWILLSSFKTTKEIIAKTPTLFPKSIVLEHYTNLFASTDFPRYLINSTIVAILTMTFVVVLTSPAAYALYRIRFWGRDFLFKIILITYAFPRMLLMIPLYMMLTSLHLIDTLWSLVIVNVTFAAPFGVWMLQAFFHSVPFEIEEAAAIDGANRFQTILKIMIPLTAPGVASVAIFSFISSWTEYMFASFLINSDINRTIPIGLAAILGQYEVDWGLLLSGAIITTLPVLILFAFVGRHFVGGLTSGAVK